MIPYSIFLCNQAGRLINQQFQPSHPKIEALQTPLQLPGGPLQPHATKTETTWEFTGQKQTLTRLMEPIDVHPAVLAEPDRPVSLVLITKVVNQHVTFCQATMLTPKDANYDVNMRWDHALLAAKPAFPVSYGKPTRYSQVRKFWYQSAPHTRINIITLDYAHLPSIIQS